MAVERMSEEAIALALCFGLLTAAAPGCVSKPAERSSVEPEAAKAATPADELTEGSWGTQFRPTESGSGGWSDRAREIEGHLGFE